MKFIDIKSFGKKSLVALIALLSFSLFLMVGCVEDREILTELTEENDPAAGIGFSSNLELALEGRETALELVATKKLFTDHVVTLVDSLGTGGYTITDENGGTGPTFTIKANTDKTVLNFTFDDDGTWTPASEDDTVVFNLDELNGTGAFLVYIRVGSESVSTETHPSIKMIKVENKPTPPTVNMAVPEVVFTEDDDYVLRLEMSKTSAEDGSVDLVPTFVSDKAKVNDYTTNAFPIDANGVITVAIAEGVDFVDVPLITTDILREYNDVISFEIANPVKANLGNQRTTEITIYDDDRARVGAAVDVKSDGAVNGSQNWACNNEGTGSLGISRRDARLTDPYPGDNRWVYLNYDLPVGLDKTRIEYARISFTSARTGKAQGDILDPLGIESITMGVYTVPDQYDVWDFNAKSGAAQDCNPGDFNFEEQKDWVEGDMINTFEWQDYMDPDTKADPYYTDQIDVKEAVEVDGNDILSLKIFPEDDTNDGERMFFEGEGSDDRSVLYVQWYTDDPEE